MMKIYYFMMEAVPNRNNPESKEFGGAFISCWVKAATKKEAASKAKKNIDEENWRFIRTEESFVAQRDLYLELPYSLECYDEACENGIAAIFHTWPIDEEIMEQ